MENEVKVKVMNAETFWREFQKTICNDSALKEDWRNFKRFTTKIMGKLDAILKLSGASTEQEYFRVDLISYREIETEENIDEKFGKLKYYAWNLEAAVEHENDYRAWMDEVIKLAHLSCDLRVVIGYLPFSEKENQTNYLKNISKVLKEKIKAWQTTIEHGEFLIIIGDSSVGKDMDKRCVYTPYLYNKKNDTFELYNPTDDSTENNLEHRE